ncbi:DegT/DnrJ/EryC1/StrS family aminotransferase [Phenylobacterium sp.]|uniref:DegT/DnrJ/EryC1/StrS family aminotransferase n=1 Tax=Phenylobacterium sp. TaxID=1871053 RepID=UPI002F4292CA
MLPYLHRIDDARWYSNFGPLLMDLERRLAERFQGAALTVTGVNATQMLALTLKAMDLPAGGLCMMPAWTFVATAQAVVEAGLVPYFVDVDPSTWMLDPETATEMLHAAPERVCAVVAVSAFGAMPDIKRWEAFREATGTPVLIDAAAAFDAACDARLPLVVSLHATKVLGIGEGGYLASHDAELVDRVRQSTTFGFRGGRESLRLGTNAKLNEYAAAVGHAALDAWPASRLRYLRAAQLLRMAFTGAPQVSFQPGWGADWVTSVCMVRLPDGATAEVERALNGEGVDTRRWWGDGCHRSPVFADCPRGPLTSTELLARSTLGLPFAVDLDEAACSQIAGAVGRAI